MQICKKDNQIFKSSFIQSFVVFIFISFFLFPTLIFAADIPWTGGNSQWSTDSNWGGGVEPGVNDNALIDNGAGGGSIPILDVDASVAGVTIDAGDLLIVNTTQTLTVGTNDVNNSGSITATIPGGGTFTLNADLVDNTGGGYLSVGADTEFRLSGIEINEGSLRTFSNGSFNITGATTLDSVTLRGAFHQTNGTSVTLVGDIDIDSSSIYTVDSTGGATNLVTSGNVSYDGQIVLSGTNASITGGSGDVFTNNLSVKGEGKYGNNLLNIVSNGLIEANVAGKTLTIDPISYMSNNFTLAASLGGFLRLNAGIYDQGPSGSIFSNGSLGKVDIYGAHIKNGKVTSGTGGDVNIVSNSTLENVKLTGTNINQLNGTTVTVIGSLDNNGPATYNLNSTTGNAILAASGDIEVTAFVNVNMADNGAIFRGASGDRIFNNGTIGGQGALGGNLATVTNNKLIDANTTGATLTFNPVDSSPVVNTATIQASNQGILTLSDGTFTNTNALIQALANSTVNLSDSKITGGTLHIADPSASVNVALSSTLDGAIRVTAGGASADLGINTLRFLTLADGAIVTLDEEVTIRPNAASHATGLAVLSGDTAEVRGGSITLNHASLDQITGSGGTFINNSYVNGYGNAGVNVLTITNSSSGVFDAKVSGQTLIVDVPNGSTFNNLGTFRASNGGELRFQGGSFISPTGRVEAVDANSSITFNGGAFIEDTTFNLATSTNTVTFTNGNSTINDSVAFAGLGDVEISNIRFLVTTSDTTLNLGSGVELKPGATSNATGVSVVSSKLTITGDGTVDLDSVNDTFTGGSGTLHNKSNITGNGKLGSNVIQVINDGLIEANNGSLAKMIIDVPNATTVDNNGTIRASNGIVEFLGGTINSADGLMEATGNNSVFRFNTNTIEDTTINLAASTSVHFDTDATLDGLSVVRTGVSNVDVDIDTNEFLVTIGNATVHFGEGVNVNRNSAGHVTGMSVVSGRLTLTGDGTHHMDHGTRDVFTGASGTLDNQSNIIGYGAVGANVIQIVNNGLIDANVDGQTMTLDQPNSSTLDNNGTIRASNGGIVRIQPGAIDSATGTFEATGANSQIELNSAVVQNTTFNLATASNTLEIVGNSSLNQTVAVTGLGEVDIDNNRFIATVGSDATLHLGSGVTLKPNQTSNATGFSVQSSELTLTGDGTTELNHATINGFYGNLGTLDNRSNILGYGAIGFNQIKVVNSAGGLIESNVDGQTMTFDVPNTTTFENSGTVRVSNGGIIQFNAGTFTSPTGVVEAVDADSVFRLNAAVIDDTTFNLATSTNAVNVVLNSTFNDTVAITGSGKVTINNVRFLALDGANVVNNTTIDPLSTSNATGIAVITNSSLNGSGLLTLNHNTLESVTGASGVTFTQGAGHTISGYGRVGSNVISVINDGSILANVSGQTLTVDPINSGSFTNNGLLEATGGGVVSIPAGGNQTNNGTIKASAGSSLTLDETWAGTTGNLIADAGTISIGAVAVHSTGNTGDTTISNGGAVIITGGTLNTGDLTISGATSSLSVASQVTVSGDFTFDTTDESLWTLGDGASDVLKMTGGVGASTTDAGAHASLEIGGTDLGTDPGTHTGAPAGFDDNFDLTRLVIGTGARVKLTDTINNGNQGGVGGSAEALYVDTLEFEDATGILNLNGLHLYYTTLIGNISQIGDAFFDWIDGVTDAGTAYVSGVIGDLPSFEIDFTTVGDVVTTGNASVAQQNNPAALPEGKSYAVTAAGDEVVYSIAPTTAVVSGSFNFSIDTANLNLFGQDPSEAFLVHNSGTLQEFFEVASIDGTTLTFTVPTNFSDFGLGVNPEPATLILLISGLLGLWGYRRK